MCQYVNVNKCKLNNEVCPWVYFCDKKQTWIASAKMPSLCKIAERTTIPSGYNKVASCRNGQLYIEMDNHVIKLPNPYDYIPQYVKVTQLKSGEYKIKKETKG